MKKWFTINPSVELKIGDPIIYVNDILNIGVAINQGDMAERYKIKASPEMLIEIFK